MNSGARPSDEPTDDEIDRVGPEYATQAQLTEQIRDMVREMLLVRRGLELTEIIAGERANNIAMAIMGNFNVKGRAR